MGIPIVGDLFQLERDIQGEFLWQANRRRKGNIEITARRRYTVLIEVERKSKEG